MISDIRKQFKSTTYRATMWIGVLALTGVFSIPTLIKNRAHNPWALKVNSTEIGQHEFQRVLSEKREWLSQIRSQYGPQADLMLYAFGIDPDPVSLTMQLLIREALWTDLARRINVYLHPSSVEYHLQDPMFVKYYLGSVVPAFLFSQQGTLDEALLKNYLMRRGIKPADFEEQVEHIIERKVAMDIMNVASYVPDFDREAFRSREKNKRSFVVMSFSFDKQLSYEKNQPLSDEEIATYYQKNKTNPKYFVPEKRSGLAWTFKPQQYGVSVTEEEIARYYDEYKTRTFVKAPKKVQVRHILIKHDSDNAQEQAQPIYDELLTSPDLFVRKAKEYSQDADSAAQGGILKPFARGEREESFERAAFLLKHDGDIAKPVRTSEGFEIIQRERVIPQEFTPLSEAYNTIAQTLLQTKLSKQIATDCKMIKNLFNSDKKAFDELVYSKGAVISELKDQPLNESILSKTLFSLKNINSMEFCLTDNGACIVALTSLQKGHTAELSEIREELKGDIYRERTRQSLDALRDRIMADAGIMPWGELYKKYEGSLYETDLVTQSNVPQDKGLQERQLEAASFDALEYPGLARMVTNDYGVHYIQLREQKALLQESIDPEISKAINQRKRLIADSFVASLYRNATIKTNESLVNLQS